jgi:thiol-disulfide isomerase/thioredoxin
MGINLRLNAIHWTLLGMAIIFLACSSEDDHSISQKITLVFENPTDSPSFRNHGTIIKYMDDNMFSHVINLDNRVTLQIPVSRKYIDVAWQDNENPTQHFLFENGDSVHLIIKDKWILAQIKNRDAEDDEVNFERKRNNDLYHGKPSSLEDFYYYWKLANAEFSTVSGKSIADDLNSLKEKANREIIRENSYIDSLKETGNLSEDVADFYLLKNAFTSRKLKLYQLTKINFEDTKLTEELFKFENYILRDSSENMTLYTFYDDMLSRLYEQYLNDTTTELNVDYLMGKTWLPKKARQSLAFRHVDNLLNSYPVEEGNFLLEHLDCSDTIINGWKEYFNKKYILDKRINGFWKLQDQAGQTLTFNELLKYYHGELLYIDFWAGWCIPCIREMPKSRKLSLEYSGKPVRFIYISIDRSVESWEYSQKKYIGFAEKSSFYLDSLNHEKVREAFQLTSIPRYMLFDRNGKLLHQNAPGPDSDEIRKLFDKYLGEKID